MGKIYAAKTNHITNPVGFYMEQIVFSWKVKECEGKKQKNARILISKEKDFSEILFDTKEAELDSCGTKVNFQTAPYTRYYWKVIVTTDQGEVVGSDVQFFETAKQDEENGTDAPQAADATVSLEEAAKKLFVDDKKDEEQSSEPEDEGE